MSNEQDSAWDASRLRDMIDKRGVRMRWLAEQCGRSQGTLTDWTQGRTQPKVTDLGDLATALRCKIIQLLPPRGA